MGRNGKEENEDNAKTTFPLGKRCDAGTTAAAPSSILLCTATAAVPSASPPLPYPQYLVS